VLYALRLSDLRVLGCHAVDAHEGESLRVFDVHPGELWIADRGYANPYDVAWVVDAGAAVLIRYKFNALPLYDAEGRPCDVMVLLRRLRKPGAMAEWSLDVRPPNHAPIKGRLCAVRLSNEATKKARERLRREEDDVSARALEAAAWMIVFTTADPDRMTTGQVLELYRTRWQVELEIRRDKSLGGLDKLPNFRDDTIATWLFGKLLIQQIARKAISPSVAFPPSAVGFDLFAGSQQNAREAPAPRQHHRRRAVASDGPRLPGHPRRTAPRATG
jgi:hypothetical protein